MAIIDEKVSEIRTHMAVLDNKIINLEGDIRDMNDKIETIASDCKNAIEKISDQYNKILIFGFSTSIGAVGTLLAMIIGMFL